MQGPPREDPTGTRSSVKDLRWITQGPLREDPTRISTRSSAKDLYKIMHCPLTGYQDLKDLNKTLFKILTLYYEPLRLKLVQDRPRQTSKSLCNLRGISQNQHCTTTRVIRHAQSAENLQ